jgi:hypothetical protein
MPPESEAGARPESERLMYDSALEAFQAGRWKDACKLLEPLAFDGAGGVLTDYIKSHPDGPPTDWGGVIAMEGK